MQEQEQKKRTRLIQVQAIERRGEAVVVEFSDKHGPNRKVVPQAAFSPEGVDKTVLDEAPDYGVCWADTLKKSEILTEKGRNELEVQMKQNGIWTTDDLRRAANKYMVVLASLHREDTRAMIGGK